MTAESKTEQMSPKQKGRLKHKKLVIVLSVVSAVVLLLISFFLITLKIGEASLRKKQTDSDTKLPIGDSESIPADADAYYNGVAYNYNDKLINILVIGVDRKKPDMSGKHQADALYLISLNSDDKTVKVIAISRNTFTDVDSYDIDGNYFSTAKQQICLAYTYSTDDKKSSENTVKAVSDLLYGVPISGYYTIFMNSLEEIVDAVGGVPVHITEDLTAVNPKMKQDTDITLSGDTALRYLQYRGESNAPRLERQKAFISSFATQAKAAMQKDFSLPIKMYNKLAKNTVTDVTSASAVYLASEAFDADFSIIGIEGVAGTDGIYETFMPDEAQLYQMILDVFYQKQ
ncbi:MAG: LCP family protein [Acutalibacteraceae bacterium]